MAKQSRVGMLIALLLLFMFGLVLSDHYSFAQLR